MSKDYGEPVALKEFDEDGFYQGWAITDKDGDIIETFDEYIDFPQDHKEYIDRSIACVNALQGIPTDHLGEVKKAWLLAMLAQCKDFEYNFFLAVQESSHDNIIDKALSRARWARANKDVDFGPELNALIDSFKE